MKILSSVLLIAALALTAAAAGTNLAGKWSGSFISTHPDGETENGTAYLVLKQNGTEITGSGGPNEGDQWPIKKGQIQNGKISIVVEDPDGGVYSCTLAIEGDHLKGDVEFSQNGQTSKGKLDITRVKD